MEYSVSSNPIPDWENPDASIDTDEVVEQLMQQRLAGNIPDDLDQRLREAHAQGELESTGVMDARGEIITGVQHAQELYQRHRILNKAQVVAQAIYLAFKQQGGMLHTLAGTLPLEGAFIEDESLQHYEEILCDPLWVIAHAGGKIRDPQTLRWREFENVADMQVQMPEDRTDAPLVTNVPHPNDPNSFFHDYHKDEAKRIAGEIHENHAIAACISNVGVHPMEYRKLGFASLARRTIAQHLRESVNPARTNQIRYLLANMFSIRGLHIPTEPRPSIALKKPILNKVSIYMHALSHQFEALYAWKARGKDIPVTLSLANDQSIPAGLRVDWETVVLPLKKRTSHP